MKKRPTAIRGWLIFGGIVALAMGLNFLGARWMIFKGKMAIPVVLAAVAVIALARWRPAGRKDEE